MSGKVMESNYATALKNVAVHPKKSIQNLRGSAILVSFALQLIKPAGYSNCPLL
jgi:hypothetical protein